MEYNGDATSRMQIRPLPWNKGKLIGPKPPLRPSQVWAIRTRLQMEDRKRDLAQFNLATGSKLRGCDAVAVRVEDVAPSGYALDRATIRGLWRQSARDFPLSRSALFPPHDE